jgi:hypothetical protein
VNLWAAAHPRQEETMLRIIVMTALLATGLAFAGDGPTHVFLLMGQSNMAGRAKAGPGDEAPLEGALLLNDKGQWEPAVQPLNKYGPDSKKPQVCLGGDFARALREARPEVRVGLIVHARGATAIAEWRADGTLYPGALARVKAAGVKLAGVLWHQGEHNFKDEAYAEKLAELIGRLRKDLDDPKLPFICGEICSPKSIVNQQMHKCAAETPRTAVARAEDLKKFDAFHFDRPSVKLLGERYAQAWLHLDAAAEGKASKESHP